MQGAAVILNRGCKRPSEIIRCSCNKTCRLAYTAGLVAGATDHLCNLGSKSPCTFEHKPSSLSSSCQSRFAAGKRGVEGGRGDASLDMRTSLVRRWNRGRSVTHRSLSDIDSKFVHFILPSPCLLQSFSRRHHPRTISFGAAIIKEGGRQDWFLNRTFYISSLP